MTVQTYFQRYEDKIVNELPGLLVQLPLLLIKLVKIEAAGGRAYFVGGTARDIIYDAYYNRYINIPDDIDIEVFGLTQEQLENIIQLQLTGKEFPVYNTIVEDLDGSKYDVQWALPRRERKNGKGHSGFEINVDPNMSLYDAAERRDLTINSIMIDLNTYTIIDSFNGIEDLIFQKRADCVSPKTFIDDPLRVLRAARQIAKFNLSPSARLCLVSRKMISEYKDLTPELREKELTKLFQGRNVHLGLGFLDDVDWLQMLLNFPNQYKCFYESNYQLMRSIQHVHIDSFNHYVVPEVSIDRELVQWAVFLNDRSSEEIIAWFKEINPNWERHTSGMVAKIVYHGNLLMDKILSGVYIARYLMYNCPNCIPEVVAYLTICSGKDWLTSVQDAFKTYVMWETFPIITGDDVLEFIPEGRDVGIVREFFVRQHIEGIVTTKQIALKMLPNVVSLVERKITI